MSINIDEKVGQIIDPKYHEMILPMARLSFAKLNKGAKYETGLIFPKDADLSNLTDAMMDAYETKHGEKPTGKTATKMKTLMGKLTKTVFEDSGEKNGTLVQADVGEQKIKGLRQINVKGGQDMPTFAILKDGKAIELLRGDESPEEREEAIDEQFKSGYHVFPNVQVYAGTYEERDKDGKLTGTKSKYISIKLQGLLFVKEDEILGRAPKTASDLFGGSESKFEDTSGEEAGGDEWDD